jgi:hypothetical protein
MTIHLYLNNEEETQIFSLYDQPSNPFKLGDVLRLDVEDLFPKDIEKYPISTARSLIDANNELIVQFKLKSVKLVREGKYIRFNNLGVKNLTIEYHCEFVEE